MKKYFWIILFVILPVVLLSLVSFFCWELNRHPASKGAGEINFTISRGETLKSISRSLEQKNIISSAWFFEILVRMSDKQNKLQAGEYKLPQGLSLLQLIDALGRAQADQSKVVLLEGESVRELASRLSEAGIVERDVFLNNAGIPLLDYRTLSSARNESLYFSDRYDFLKDKPVHYGLEGYLFPDTYRFARAATSGQVIIKMLDNFNKKLTPDMRGEIKRQNKTIWEVVIMASLLEKEVRHSTDMKMVADLFWRRLERGQALQSDATLSYVLDDKTAAHTLADLELDSPYNSYMYKGLPPTPIGNPGAKALEAAIYPTPNTYNFFLNDPKTGDTIFAETFEGHKQNKVKYLY